MLKNIVACHKLLFISLILFISGCGPSPGKVIEQQRAAVQAKLSAIAAIAELVRANTRLAGDDIKLEGPPPSFTPSQEKTNAVVMGPEHFVGLPPDLRDFHISFDKPLANTLALLKDGNLADGKQPENGAAVKAIFETILDLRYILVLRISDQKPGAIRGMSFDSGSCTGEAQLYDVQLRKLVGGIHFKVRNSDTVELTRENAELFLHNDLRKNAIKLIRDEFKRRFPQANPPLTK